MTMMIAADPMTVENGCLEVVREQHEKGTFPMKPADGSMTDDVVNSMKWEPVVTKAGDEGRCRHGLQLVHPTQKWPKLKQTLSESVLSHFQWCVSLSLSFSA